MMTESEKWNTLRFIRAVKRAAWILCLIILGVTLVMNFTHLNGDDIGRLFARIGYSFKGEVQQSEAVSFTGGEAASAAVFKDGICAVADDRMRVYDAAGVEFLDTQLVMDSPCLAVSSRAILAADRGGKTVVRFGSFSETGRLTYDQPVITAAMSESGAVAVAHKSEGYRSELSVYDSDLNERYHWYGADTYITGVSVFGIPTIFACTGITLKEGEMACEVLTFSPEKEEPLLRKRIEGSFIYAVKFLDRTTLAVITDLGYTVLNAETGEILRAGDHGQTLGCFSMSDTALIFGYSERGAEGYTVRRVSLGSGKAEDTYLSIEPKSVALSGEVGYVMTAEGVYSLQPRLNELTKTHRGEERIETCRDGRIVIFTNKSARFITP